MQLRKWHISLALATALVGCGDAAYRASESRRYHREKVGESLAQLEKPGIVIGEFTLAREPVVDGDTIKVDGLETTLRLLNIDTEETFKNESDRRAATERWDEYVAEKKAAMKRPGRISTPMGEEAKRFAKEFFAGVAKVRLERDHPKEVRGRFGRYLVYVLVESEDGGWINYNIEAVRAGMSPYYTKYGYSRRFHDQFVQAEAEARAAKRGIWSPETRHYPDYEERLAWWRARADFIQAFEREAEGKDNYISIGDWDSLKRLEEHLDKEVFVLGAISEIRMGDRGPTRVLLGRRLFSDFPLIFFDKDVYGSSRIADYKGEFVKVRGFVSKYTNKYNGRQELQIIVNLPGQITLPRLPGKDETTHEPSTAASP